MDGYKMYEMDCLATADYGYGVMVVYARDPDHAREVALTAADNFEFEDMRDKLKGEIMEKTFEPVDSCSCSQMYVGWGSA